MIYTDILLIRDNYAIQQDNMTLLVVTAQQYYNGRTYANYSTTQRALLLEPGGCSPPQEQDGSVLQGAKLLVFNN